MGSSSTRWISRVMDFAELGSLSVVEVIMQMVIDFDVSEGGGY